MSVERIQQHFRDSAALQLEALDVLSMPIAAAVDTMFGALANGNKILACGNGASATDAQRFAAQLTARFERERPGLPAIALTADCAVLTALAEDGPYEDVYARQVRALGHAGDVLLAVTATGDSANVLAAIAEAHEREMVVIALTGNGGGKGGGKIGAALGDTDIPICVPSERPARIHELHLLTIHCLCDGIDAMLLGED
jgi:D-sedoheptulose 7-phosphate isomerase